MPYKIENNPLFSESTKSLLAEQQETSDVKNISEPEKVVRKINSYDSGSFTRATFIVQVKLLEDLKNYAYTERLTLKELVNELLSIGLDNYKKNGGTLLNRKEVSKE